MLVYVLSNTNQTLGVFSTPLEAQKYYSTLYNGIIPVFNVKLEEFRLNNPIGKDISLFLKQKPFEENIKPKLDYYRGKFKKRSNYI